MLLFIGIGAAAVIALGAFFFMSGRARKNAEAQTNDHALAGAATRSAPPIKVVENKPAPSGQSLVTSAATSLDPALQARLDAVPWVKVDLSAPMTVSGQGTTEFKDGRLVLQNQPFVTIIGNAKDAVIRVRVSAAAQEALLKLEMRTARGQNKRITAGRETVNGDGVFSTYDTVTRENIALAPQYPLPGNKAGYTIELFAIGAKAGVIVEGKLTAIGDVGELDYAGETKVMGLNALIESIEYKILDGVVAPAGSAALALAPEIQARLDAMPWTKFDPTKKFDASGKLRQTESGKGIVEFKDGRITLKDSQYLTVIDQRVADCAIRVQLAANPTENRPRINLRVSATNKRINAGREDKLASGALTIIDGSTQAQTPVKVSPDFPMPPAGTACTLEVFALGDTCGVKVNDQLVALASNAEAIHPGTAQLYGLNALIESIEYKILDGVAAPAVARTSKSETAPPPTTDPVLENRATATDLDAPGWKRLDLAKVKEEPGKVERLPDGAVRLTGGRIWTDAGYAGDVSIRARFRGIPDSRNQRIMIRDDNGMQYMANLWSGGGNFRCEGWSGENYGKGHDLPAFPKHDTTKTFTLELRAQGSTLTVLVDGKQVAQAQDDQLKFGRLGVFADRGIVEGIAYQAGDAAAPADDDAGWQKVDLATLTLSNPEKVARLPDGTLNLKGGSAWLPTIHEDVRVRARFKAGASLKNPSVMVRDTDGIAYSLSPYDIATYVWGGEALRRGDKETKTKKIATFPRPSGDVQTLELVVEGTRLTGFINGQKVAESTDDMLKTGRVGVFANDGIVESFEIKPIPKDRATVKPGELVWKISLGESYINGGLSQGPDGTVYVAAKTELVAVSPKDGAILWRSPFEGEARGGCVPVVADDGTVLLAVHGGKLHAFDGTTGKARWSFSFEEGGTFTESSPAVTADGKVYFGHKSAFCLDLADGKQLWRTDFPNETSRTPPVIAVDGTVVFTPSGVILAMHPLTGAIKWQARFPNVSYAEPAVDGTTLFVNCNGGSTTALNSGVLRAYDVVTGRMLWEHRTENFSNANLALDGRDRVFTRDMQGRVVACSAPSGTRLWNAHEKAEPDGFSIGTDGLIYTDLGRDFACLNPENGDIVWRVASARGNSIWGVPLLTEDGLYISASGDRDLYAIQTSSKGLADSPWPTMGQNNRRNGRAKDAQVVVAQDTPTDKKLREIEARVRAEYDAGPGKVFADATATLRTQYTNALKARAAQSQQGGHLDHMLAFKQEADAFAAGTITAPPVDAPSTPEPLKQLRETFRKTMTGHEATRDKAAAPIYTKWDTALAALQAELTKTGEINEALRVKKLRDQIVQTKALTVATIGNRGPAPAATPVGSQNRPTTTKAPAPKLAKGDDRKIAEWVLSIPGSRVQYLASNGDWSSDIMSADKLPRGDLKLLKVQLASAASVKEEDLLRVAGLEKLQALNIESDGFTCLTPAVIAALAQTPEFREIIIKGSNLEDADFAPLAGKKMTGFKVDECPKLTGKALAYFTQASLVALHLKACPITDDNFSLVAQMKNLRIVKLDGLKLSEALFDALPANLDELSLARMGHLKGKLAAITRFKGLTALDFAYWPGVTAEDAMAIASLPSLRSLNAPGCGGDAIRHFATLKKLEKLTLSTIPQDGNAALGSLAACKALRSLHLAGVGGYLDDSGLATLAAVQQLEELNFSGQTQITDASLPHIAKLAKLTSFKLAKAAITDTGLEPLKALKKLEELDLTGTQVTAGGVAAIQKALPKCKVLGP